MIKSDDMPKVSLPGVYYPVPMNSAVEDMARDIKRLEEEEQTIEGDDGILAQEGTAVGTVQRYISGC